MAEELSQAQQEKNAFTYGLALSEFANLFAYFLNQTPEGVQVKKDLEHSWQETFLNLKENKKIRGADFSLAQWLQQIQHQLAQPKNPPSKKPAKFTAGSSTAKSTAPRKKKPLRFKNV